jgi:hypothetical protein
MTSTRAQEVLYESEAALRLVDHELNGMHDVRDAAETSALVPALPVRSHDELSQILEQATIQILDVLRLLRESRTPLRDECDRLADGLDLQSIVSQQWSHASSVLVETESRLLDVARVLANGADDTTGVAAALADDIFTAVRAPAA